MHQLKHDASDMKAAVHLGDVAQFAAILQRSWLAKKRTANRIQHPYRNLEERARRMAHWRRKFPVREAVDS